MTQRDSISHSHENWKHSLKKVRHVSQHVGQVALLKRSCTSTNCVGCFHQTCEKGLFNQSAKALTILAEGQRLDSSTGIEAKER